MIEKKSPSPGICFICHFFEKLIILLSRVDFVIYLFEAKSLVHMSIYIERLTVHSLRKNRIFLSMQKLVTLEGYTTKSIICLFSTNRIYYCFEDM